MKKILEIKNYIINNSYDEKYGARPIRRAVQVHLEDRIAEEILSGKLATGDTAVLTIKQSENPEEAVPVLRRTKKHKNN